MSFQDNLLLLLVSYLFCSSDEPYSFHQFKIIIFYFKYYYTKLVHPARMSTVVVLHSEDKFQWKVSYVFLVDQVKLQDHFSVMRTLSDSSIFHYTIYFLGNIQRLLPTI